MRDFYIVMIAVAACVAAQSEGEYNYNLSDRIMLVQFCIA